jgi:hypothetical protein
MRDDLKFNEDGTFKIVQFTDTHWKNGLEEDQNTKKLMEDVIDVEKPNLIVFTGDNIFVGNGSSKERTIGEYRKLIEPIVKKKIPWASIFGNHDVEDTQVTREDMMRIKMEYDSCYSELGPVDVRGVGNYVLEIKGSKVSNSKALLYFLDSGTDSDLPMGGYDYIAHNQIQWYMEKSKEMTSRNLGTPLPALAFFHIPLPEYKDVWYYHTCYGEKNEEVCSAKVNTGLFSAMLIMGDVMGVFVGHDHINDYWGEMHGIKLCYGRCTGYNCYGKTGFLRGARVIEMKEGQRAFDTWLRLDDMSIIKEQKEHRPYGEGSQEIPST